MRPTIKHRKCTDCHRLVFYWSNQPRPLRCPRCQRLYTTDEEITHELPKGK